jgi:hypothetical protein
VNDAGEIGYVNWFRAHVVLAEVVNS